MRLHFDGLIYTTRLHSSTHVVGVDSTFGSDPNDPKSAAGGGTLPTPLSV